MNTGIRAAAFGGGHGLAATLQALKGQVGSLTAIVGVSDNGGSSGRLRNEFGLLPPGDLRMALTALCSEGDWGQSWAAVLQHRFRGDGPLGGHALGNLLITALWQQDEDLVGGLRAVGELLGCEGVVLPLSLTPLDVVAQVEMGGALNTVSGQVEVATASGRVRSVSLVPEDAAATPQALQAVAEADVLFFGPGSWFSSVMTSFALPQMRAAVAASSARKVLIANLCSQQGETQDFSPAEHFLALRAFAPEVAFDTCLVDSLLLDDELLAAAASLGAKAVSYAFSSDPGAARHNPIALRRAIGEHLPRFGGNAL